MNRGRVLSWESHLIVRAADGDIVAFELIADQYRPILLNVAMRIVKNRDDANDIVQDALIRALRAIGDFDPERQLRPWLCRICANCAMDTIRQKKRDADRMNSIDGDVADNEIADDVTSECFQHGQIVDAINRLPEKYRSIILMRHFRHMDVTEIAAELNKPEGTIKSWLHRARALLKKDLYLAFG